jgi:hypothetical protein
VLILDQTYVGHQGEQTENTFSRANTKPRKKNSGRGQRKNAKHSSHAFICGLLLSPRGRIPLMKSYYTKEYAQQKKLTFKTQAALAADLIRSAPVAKALVAVSAHARPVLRRAPTNPASRLATDRTMDENSQRPAQASPRPQSRLSP